MKLKSTVHFIEAGLSKPHSHCQYMASSTCILPTTYHQFRVPVPLTLKGWQKSFMVGIKKWHAFVDTTSIPVPLCRYKRSSGRHKWSCKQSCSAFQNVLVYEASTLWKKPSYSQKKPSNLRCSCTTNAHSEKCSEGWRLFSDACQTFVPSLVHNVCVHGNFH